MTRETEEKKNIGKIKFVSVQSSDNRVSVPALIFEPAVAKSMKQWVEGLTKYYTKNHKQI